MNKNAPVIRFQGFHDDWEQRKLGEVLQYEQPSKYIVKSTEYDNSFLIPVLTAGQSFILGYTNENNGIKEASKKRPIIIFDDFTTSSHFVDFPFKIKSSAMKLLSLKNESSDFYFIYHILKNVQYTPKDHSRQWISEFSKFHILIPNNVEQQKIGLLFKHFDNLITLHQRKLNLLKEQKKSLLQKMFPKKDEKIPEIRFNGFTDDWEQRKVRELFIVTRGQVLAVSEVSSIKTLVNPYPVYSSQTKNNGLLGYYHDYLFDGGITWTTDGANAGTVKYRKGRFYSTNVNGVLLSNDGYINKALAEILNKSAWKYVSHVGNPKLMNNVMSDIKIEIPTKISEQQKLSGLIDKLDNLITLHQRKLDALQEQKKGLLQKMFV